MATSKVALTAAQQTRQIERLDGAVGVVAQLPCSGGGVIVQTGTMGVYVIEPSGVEHSGREGLCSMLMAAQAVERMEVFEAVRGHLS